jgi:asparagine synthase (glutamine-hydrolysing)
MPGIAAILSPHLTAEHERDVGRMRDTLRHEPYYTIGAYTDRAAGVGIAWSCHPGSYCDCLPIKNGRDDLLLFFYGEHHADDNGASPATGESAAASPDARRVLALYEEHGRGFLTRLNGWYHGLLLDRTRAEILVFNDRLGMQRLYFHENADAVLIASEAKALLKVRKSLRALDPRGLADFLSCGAVLENRTLFADVQTLPAGTAWTFRHGRPVSRDTYFRPEEWERQPPLAPAQVEERLGELMPRLVARHAKSRLPVAVSLTGGYDTRMIMAYLNGGEPGGSAYTFGGIYRDCFDVKIARKVAAQCGYRHEVLNLDGEFFASFPRLAEQTVYISDGTLGACNAYELYLNRRARRIAPLKLTGSFGSEVMRGARAFRAAPGTPGLLQPELAAHVEQSVANFAGQTQGHGLTFSVFKHAPWYYSNRLAIEQSQLIVRTPFLDNDLIALMYRAQPSALDCRELARRLIRRGHPGLAAMPTDTGNTAWWRHAIRHFLFQADYCYKSGMPQWLEQIHFLCGPLQPERLLIGVHRFQHFRVWFRRQLASYIRDLLLDPRTLGRPYFNRAFVEQMVSRHLKGDRNYTDDIERVMTVELAHRTLLEAA